MPVIIDEGKMEHSPDNIPYLIINRIKAFLFNFIYFHNFYFTEKLGKRKNRIYENLKPGGVKGIKKK
jgi:hypothetical protein